MHSKPCPVTVRIPSLAALSLALAVGCWGCSDAPPDGPAEAAPPPRVAEVQVLTLAPERWQQQVLAYGVIEPAEDLDVSVDLSAEVAAVHFDEGDQVAAGQLLIELDSAEQGLRLEQAEAAVAEARAGLDEARSDHERRRGLAGSGAVSREVLERSELALARAGAWLEDALAARALAEREVREGRIESPVDGTVERRQVEPGERVMPGQVLASIQTLGRVRVRAHVGEREVNDLAAGSAAEVRSPGARGRVFDAVIESVGMRADPETGNFPVRLTLPNEDARDDGRRRRRHRREHPAPHRAGDRPGERRGGGCRGGGRTGDRQHPDHGARVPAERLPRWSGRQIHVDDAADGGPGAGCIAGGVSADAARAPGPRTA